MSAALIATAVQSARVSASAEPCTNYDTFTPQPRPIDKGKKRARSPSVASDLSDDISRVGGSLHATKSPFYFGQTPRSETPESEPEVPGCFARLFTWLRGRL